VVGDGFIFVEKDFPTSEKKIVQIFTLFLAFWVFKKVIILFRFVFYCYYFIDKLPCFLISWWHFWKACS